MLKPLYARLGLLISVPAILTIAGCSDNTAGNDSARKSSSITISVLDDSGKPLPGFEVTTIPETRKILSDSTGMATLDQIPAGTYAVTVAKENYPDFTQSVPVNADGHEHVSFIYISTLLLTVKDDRGKYLSGASISSIPATDERVADENGRAVFSNMPQTSLQFVIRRERYPDVSVPVELKSREAQITVESSAPRVDIFSPKLDDSFTSPYNIRLTGRGTDIEDGVLPDSSLVWTSDIDGELGTGQTMVVPFLSNGYHVVTLRGADSDGKNTETSVAFMVFDYQLDSYFPIPAGESWVYRYLVPEFYLTNTDNVSEYWVLKGLNVKTDKQLRRTVDIYWDTTAQMVTTHFRLTLVDSLIADEGNLYIGQTVEQSREWTGAVEKPYFIMHIATSYQPWYTFLKNVTDISREPSYSTSVRTEIMYTYSYYNNQSTVFHESKVLNTSLQVGNEETIQTDKGLIKARSLTIKQGNSEKKWYLAKGLGLIRLEDKALNISTVAVMTSASLYRFHSPLGKEAGGIALMTAPGDIPRFDLRIDRKKPEDRLRLHRFLTGLAPRL